MQVHSHLIKNEIIGFLAGYSLKKKDSKEASWSQSTSSTLVITEAYHLDSYQDGACYDDGGHSYADGASRASCGQPGGGGGTKQ